MTDSAQHQAETAEIQDDGPECDLCGKTTCPDADLPEFSEPVACEYLPIYDSLRYDRCDYGCARDITKATIRRDIVPTVERLRSPGSGQPEPCKCYTPHECDRLGHAPLSSPPGGES